MSAQDSFFKTKLTQLANFWRTESVPFVTAYVVTGILAFLVPAIRYRKSVNTYQSSYYYQYQQQNQSEDNGGNEYDINNCKWWQWNCTPQYMNENGEYVEQNQDENGNYYTTPNWFSGWGNGNRSGDRSGDGGTSNSAALKFVYAWQLILFLGLLAYGGLTIYKFRPSNATNAASSRMALQSLLLLLFLWTNTTFMAMWMLANGSISVEGREIEELGGFSNQFSVMMFLSNFWYTVWGLLFCVAIGIRIYRTPKADADFRNSSSANAARPGDSTNYLPYCEPSITVTGVENTSKPSNASWFS